MFKVTLRSLLGHKIRVILTTFVVVLGVSSVVASFVIRDGVKEAFSDLFTEINQNTDATIRARTEFDEVGAGGGGGNEIPISEDLVEVVRGVEGVREAVPALQASLVPIDPDGDPLTTFGPPFLSFAWSGSDLSPLNLVDGEAADGPGEFMLDVDTFADNNYVIGETYEVIADEGRIPVTLVGTFKFGEDNALLGAILSTFELNYLQELIGEDGNISSIAVAAEAGISDTELVGRLEAVLPGDVEAVASTVIADESADDVGFFADIIGNALLGFALITLFVAAFLINNTFNIVLGQRVRELALLRAVGATATQVRRSVIAESIVIGVLAAVVGIVAGIGVSFGIRALFDLLGFGLPSMPLVLAPRTIIIGFLLGTIITVLASLSPARKAAVVPPVAAMRDGFQFGAEESRRRTIVGIAALVLGAVGMGYGLFGDPPSTPALLLVLGGGALVVFVGVALLSPLVASPVASAIGRPLQWAPWLRISGRLARDNASRNPRRTAATATALMIGLALVSTVVIVGESFKRSFRETLNSTIQADFFISNQDGFGSFSPQLAEDIAAEPEFEQATGMRFGRMRVDGSGKDVGAASLSELDQMLDLDVISGDVMSAGQGDLLIHKDPAEDLGVAVGDTLEVEFAVGGVETLTVAAVYEDATVLGNWIIDLSTWDENFSIDDDFFVAARVAEGVTIEQARGVLEDVTFNFPQVDVEDRSEFRESQESQLDSLLAIVNGMLVFALIVAILGIANTMALSVFERTRELGLLRAVGMSRRQVRGMVRWEGAIVAVFGAILGIALGLIFGWAIVLALPDSFVSTFAVPIPTLIAALILSAVAGLAAALFPAIRASRLNVLRAIAHE